MTTQERRTDMPTETTPYITRNPGDLITAEDWNEMQRKIKEDIAAQVRDAIDKIDKVPNADNAAKLETRLPMSCPKKSWKKPDKSYQRAPAIECCSSASKVVRKK
jgi:hypothetical protein